MALHGQQVELPDAPVVHTVVAAHARRRPDHTALTCGAHEAWTYRRLDARANQFARHLRSRGVARGSVVGVCLERSPELMVAILGILKAGAAYVPLDPSHPQDRLRLMLAQLPQMELIAVSPQTRGLIDTAAQADLTALARTLDSMPDTAPDGHVVGDDTCYVVFTSGSTGVPKATAVTHRGWYNLLNWLRAEYHLDPATSGLTISAFGFDLTQRALMTPLFVGATLHLLPSLNFDASLAYRLLGDLGVKTVHCAPSAFYLLLDHEKVGGNGTLARMSHAFIGGEPISKERVADWIRQPTTKCAVHNVYGVAECTDISSAYRMTAQDEHRAGPLPAGLPIHNTGIRLLDADLGEVPDGETGEIGVTGTGVGAGYLGEAADSGRFVVAADAGGRRTRLYLTGDRGYVTPECGLVVVGRVDAQVKVRGMRIDLGDVEAAIRRHRLVRDAAVVAAPDADGEIELVAAVLPADGAIEPRALRRDLLGTLPAGMIPRRLVEVAELPLNPNGKIDRSALALRLRATGPLLDGGGSEPEGT